MSDFAAGFTEVFGAIVLVVTVDTDESSSELAPDPIAWNPTSKKMTPRNSSTITMARRGSPVESGTRSFIDVTVSRSAPKPTPTLGGAGDTSGDFETQPSCRPRLLPTGTQPSQPFDQHRVGCQCFGPVDQSIQHLVVARGRHCKQLFD